MVEKEREEGPCRVGQGGSREIGMDEPAVTGWATLCSCAREEVVDAMDGLGTERRGFKGWLGRVEDVVKSPRRERARQSSRPGPDHCRRWGAKGGLCALANSGSIKVSWLGSERVPPASVRT